MKTLWTGARGKRRSWRITAAPELAAVMWRTSGRGTGCQGAVTRRCWREGPRPGASGSIVFTSRGANMLPTTNIRTLPHAFALWLLREVKQHVRDLSDSLGGSTTRTHGEPHNIAPTFSGYTFVCKIELAARLEYMNLLPLWISGRPRVGAWWGRIQARPAFKAGLSNRLTITDFKAMKKFGGAIRQRLGERRNEYLEEFGPED